MMKTKATLTLILTAIASASAAQTWPTKPVRIVTPFPPGGGTDIVARTVAQKLGEQFKVNFVVDNRAGAGGIIGTEIAAKSPPDGYTLLLGSAGPLTIVTGMRSKLPYDVARDLAPIGLICVMPYVMAVHPVLPVKTVKELVALAKARPKQMNYGTPGNGTTTHLAMELFKTMAVVDIVHVPFKGVAPAVAGLVGGETQVMSGDLSTMMPHVKSARVRPLATTGIKRSSMLPDLPTVAESGVPGYDAVGWFGLLAPAAADKEVIARLATALTQAVNDKEARARLGNLGGDVIGSSPEQFTAHIRSETAKWAKIIAAAGVREDGAP